MKKLLSLFILFLLLPTAGAVVWVKTYTPKVPVQEGAYLNGAVYLAGTLNSSVALIALTENGSPIWGKLYRLDNWSVVRYMRVGGNSIFLVASIGNVTNQTPVVLKLDPSGNVLWARELSLNSQMGVVVPIGGGILVLLNYRRGIVVAKMNGNGSIAWARLYVPDNGSLSVEDALLWNESLFVCGQAEVGGVTNPFAMRILSNWSVAWAEVYPFGKKEVLGNEVRSSNGYSWGMAVSNGTLFISGNPAGPGFFLLALRDNGSLLWMREGVPEISQWKTYGVFPNGPTAIPNGVFLPGSSLVDGFALVFNSSGDLMWGGGISVPEGGLYTSSDFSGDGVYVAGFTRLGYPVLLHVNGNCLSKLCLPFRPLHVEWKNASIEVERLGVGVSEIGLKSKEITVRTSHFRVSLDASRSTIVVNVTSKPGDALLLVDNVTVGRTPTAVFLFPGLHRFTLRKEGYFNVSRWVRIGEQTSPLTFELIPRQAELNVSSTPEGAEIYLDGLPLGKTPLSRHVQPGNYTLTIVLKGYFNWTKNVTLGPGENLTINAALRPKPGVISVVSHPEGAKVYVDGNYTGKTPLNVSVSAGKHEVRLSLRNHETYSTTVEVEPGALVSISEVLKPLPGMLFINSTPSNLTALVTGTNITKTCITPCSLLLPPGEYIVNVSDGKSWNATKVEVKANSTSTAFLMVGAPKKGSKVPLLIALTLLALGSTGAYLYWRKNGVGVEEVTRTEKAIEVKAGKAFGISHVGARDNNEDNLLIMRLPDAYLLAVADGLGGHNAGEVASQIAVDTLKEVFGQGYRKGMSNKKIMKLLRISHELAHKRILENAVGDKEGMGTTLVTAVVKQKEAVIANTGDSRAYLIRNGKIIGRTKDHSLVQELLDKGEITEEEAKRHPMRNIITKALGIDFGVDLYEWKLEKGDVLLLSSDGLHDYVDEKKIVEIASEGKSAEEIAKKLIEEALPVTRDNVTVIVFQKIGGF
ncbi:PEGA domain-containing protein [Thermococcus sp.]|uniref:PEGA domain-containing protein n=1 Tax=Thermococcus sp. TaxID=35749 RepID=UPI0025CF0C37|nr:PEGA domain-containing protein [Thermococcus sp.]